MARGTLIVVPLLLALLASTLAQQQPTRRVRVRARPLQPPPQPAEQVEAEARSADTPVQVQYYAVAPEEQEEPQALVVVQQPRGRPQPLYGNQLVARADEPEYRQPSTRPLSRAVAQSPRTKEHAREPPVQTLRNFNTINDDGSFTFGYEAADGSFKEETRGTDCVVRGKYGYIDPDGNKREFTYVSGNPCDPNNPNPDEDERELEDDSAEENVPVRPAQRRPVPVRPRPAPQPIQPAQAVFQNDYEHGQRIVPQAKAVNTQVPITPRPVNHLRNSRPVQPTEATTYRPQIQNYPVHTERTVPRQQQIFYTTHTPAPAIATTRGQFTAQPTPPSAVNFDEELKRFQIEAGTPTLRPVTAYTPTPTPKSHSASQNIIPTTQFIARPTQSSLRAGPQQAPRPAGPTTSINPYYSSQLVFDPATGQYNTVLYQNLPKGGDFSTNHRLQAYVAPQQQQQQQLHHQQPQQHHQQQQQQHFRHPQNLQYIQPQSFQPTPSTANVGPAQFQAPSATPAATAQYSQPQAFARPTPSRDAQSFYYINPNLRNQFSTGQIDAFLRGHNIQF